MALTLILANCYRHTYVCVARKALLSDRCKMAKTLKYVKSAMAVELAAIAK